jgi:hypothetical protein
MSSTKPVSSVSSCVIFGCVTKVLTPPDLYKAALDQILNRLPHGCAADLKPLDQAVFRRQSGLWGQAAVSDIAGQNRFDAFVVR